MQLPLQPLQPQQPWGGCHACLYRRGRRGGSRACQLCGRGGQVLLRKRGRTFGARDCLPSSGRIRGGHACLFWWRSRLPFGATPLQLLQSPSLLPSR